MKKLLIISGILILSFLMSLSVNPLASSVDTNSRVVDTIMHINPNAFFPDWFWYIFLFVCFLGCAYCCIKLAGGPPKDTGIEAVSNVTPLS